MTTNPEGACAADLSGEAWKCAGCGRPSLGRERACDCPTNVLCNAEGQIWKESRTGAQRMTPDPKVAGDAEGRFEGDPTTWAYKDGVRAARAGEYRDSNPCDPDRENLRWMNWFAGFDAAITPPNANAEGLPEGRVAVSADAIGCLEIRSPLNRAIFAVLHAYRLSNMSEEDDPCAGYPLLDLMSNEAPADIGTGEMEMVALTDEIEEAVLAASPTPTKAANAEGQGEVKQADRDAAAAYWKSQGIGTQVSYRAFKSGDRDDSDLVQAFARHRQAAVADLVEALERARDYVERKSSDAFDDREDKLLAVIDEALAKHGAAK